MKPLLILIRIILVGLLWSVFFMESIRVIMLRNWHFDILNMEHWQIAWDLWCNSWVISEPKEWAFVLIIISFIPLWFTGWIALSLISWGKMIFFVLSLPWRLIKTLFYNPVKIITTNTGVTPIKKKRSYKEIRPRAIRPLVNNQIEAPASPINIPVVTPVMPVHTPSIKPVRRSTTLIENQPEPQKFEHALFKFDDDFDDIDFDIDSFDIGPQKEEKKEEKKNRDEIHPKEHREENIRFRENRRDTHERRREKNIDVRETKRTDRNQGSNQNYNQSTKERASENQNRYKEKNTASVSISTRQPTGTCMDIIKQKGYEVINRVTIKNTVIDYIGISENRICLCMLDREPGDWLADEERFNDEEPLWFSESSHRISPVRKIDIAKQALLDKLDMAEMNFMVDAFVIIQIGNIINAEDMFETWEELNINVTRIDRGTPKEIKLFARTLPEAEKALSASKLDKVIKLIRSMS